MELGEDNGGVLLLSGLSEFFTAGSSVDFEDGALSSLTSGAFATDGGAVCSPEGYSVRRPVLVLVFSPSKGTPMAKEHTNATNRKSLIMLDDVVCCSN
jgi:hypothetical protein